MRWASPPLVPTNQDRSTTREFERLAESGDHPGHDGHVPRNSTEWQCSESPVERSGPGYLRSHKQQDGSLQTQQKRQAIGPEPYRHQSQRQTKTSCQTTQCLSLHFSLTALPGGPNSITHLGCGRSLSQGYHSNRMSLMYVMCCARFESQFEAIPEKPFPQ